MAKYVFICLMFLGVCALVLPEISLGWGGGGWGGGGGGWGGGGGGGDKPGGGGAGGGGGTGGGGRSGGGAGRPPGGGAGTGKGGKLTDPILNREFDFEFIDEKEDEYHREGVASLLKKKN
ncbi:MAG: hypothetical protein ACYS47_04915 [Planctomycetota bacterium]